MIKYEITEKRAKFYYGIRYNIVEGCTLYNFEYEPKTLRTYDTKAEAVAEFNTLSTRIEKIGKGAALHYIVTEYYILKNKYNKEGNLLDCLNIGKISPIKIKLINLTDCIEINTYSKLSEVEMYMFKLMSENPDKDYKIELPDNIYY